MYVCVCVSVYVLFICSFFLLLLLLLLLCMIVLDDSFPCLVLEQHHRESRRQRTCAWQRNKTSATKANVELILIV